MTKRIQWLLGIFLVFPLLTAAAGPGFVLKDPSGNARNVNEFIGNGKWTVVAIWASDCGVCEAEIHHMVFFHDEHRKKDAIVLGVSIDGYARKEAARRFIDRHGLNFTNLLAEPQDLGNFPGPFLGTPTYYIYTPEGEVIARQVGALTQEQVERFLERMKARNESRDTKG